jgi:hypothetical protein
MTEIREFATWGIDEPLRVRKWVPLEDHEAELAQIKRTREQERDYVDVCYENERLRNRCAALALLLYPRVLMRQAVEGDI